MTELDALAEINFMPFFRAHDVWRDDLVHVDGLHTNAYLEVTRLYNLLKRGDPVSNVVIQGRPGIGKTHFIGRLRPEVMASGDIFVLFQLSSADQFWQSLVVSYMDSLSRLAGDGRSQVANVLESLFGKIGLDQDVSAKAVKGDPLSGSDIRAIRTAIRTTFAQDTRAIDVAIALILYANQDYRAQDIGQAFLQAAGIAEDDKAEFGFRALLAFPRDVVKSFDRIVAASDKVSVVAIDQLDGLIAVSSRTDDINGKVLLDTVATGLMDFAEDCENTLIILSCLVRSWLLIQDAVSSAHYRFPVKEQLSSGPSADVGQALVAAHFTRGFSRAKFDPPYPTWPIHPSSFGAAHEYTPRDLLLIVEEHIRKCRQQGRVEELRLLNGSGTVELPPDIAPSEPTSFSQFDATFEAARRSADIGVALDEKTVDVSLPKLLRAGISAWVDENPDRGPLTIDPPPGPKPPLHGRLRKIIDAETESEIHCSFRAVFNSNAVAALNRLRAAIVSSGLGLGAANRRLYVLRNNPWARGQVTQQTLAEFRRLGGKTMPLEAEDLKIFSALEELLTDHKDEIVPWLKSRRPASQTKLFDSIFGSPSAQPDPSASPASPPPDAPTAKGRDNTQDNGAPEIALGVSTETGRDVMLRLEHLRRHVAIFAGSGSGKTVLVRRLIEECALLGVSSIVLDPNNDLARLGTSWPQPPKGWGNSDEANAKRYFETTEVVIWTPRRETGRPLAFQPLADLLGMKDDAEEFAIALDNAVENLLPRARLPSTGGKAEQGRAVLKQALHAFAQGGGGELREFLTFLSDLPDGVSNLANAGKLARDISQTLIAVTVNDPLFGGDGEAADPGLLLTPSKGKNARISVISFIGLPNNDQRQSFVNQLQMALFAWVKKHPAGERPLGGLLVMDEAQIFAPSSPATASTSSTLALASQARKYGLGLILATQAPKGLHNRVAGNTTTQFYGFLNAPAQIEAAKEMAAAKGGAVNDISRLTTGNFYLASENINLQKISAPLCLSYHPKSPLTEQEVLELSRQTEI